MNSSLFMLSWSFCPQLDKRFRITTQDPHISSIVAFDLEAKMPPPPPLITTSRNHGICTIVEILQIRHLPQSLCPQLNL